MRGMGNDSLQFEKAVSAKMKRRSPKRPSIKIKEKKDETFSVVFDARERFLSVRVVPEVIEIIIRTLKVMTTAMYDRFMIPKSLL